MWKPDGYTIRLPSGELDPPVIRELFRRVWRTSLDQPGFAVVRFTEPIDSRGLRQKMFELAAAFPIPFVPERLGRFDQQVTSKFHRDGAPPRSLLLLGYEQSQVRSRVFVADAYRAAVAAGTTADEFLAANNPMSAAGEAKLAPFVTEIDIPHGEPFVVAINNSQLPFDPAAGHPLGLLHKAAVPAPDPAASRVINSAGLMPADEIWTALGSEAIKHFLTRDDLD